MLMLRGDNIVFEDLDEDGELIFRINGDEDSYTQQSFINEVQAKKIVQHFKTQFGWNQ